jgi:crotonobetainyl-CoA:carnitine CoA-transferase CaiB-like acyl-CoA transferase
MNTSLDSAASPPLSGLKVLEISAAGSFAASLLAMILAEQGADVAKVGLDAENLPVNPEFSTSVSRETRARPGIDRNKQVLQAVATERDIRQLVELADVVVLPYDTGNPELVPQALREKYPSLVVVSLCEFDTLTSHAPRDGVAGAATGMFTDMNMYDRLFSPGTPLYTTALLPSAYAAVHGAAAVGLALLRRAKINVGEHVTVSLAGSFLQAQCVNLIKDWPGNKPLPKPLRRLDRSKSFHQWAAASVANLDNSLQPFSHLYECADGEKLCVLCSPSKKHPPQLLRALGLWETACEKFGISEEDFAKDTKLNIRKNRGLVKMLKSAFAKQSAAYWDEKLGAVVPVAKLRSTEEWFAGSLAREIGLRTDVIDPIAGSVGVPGPLVYVNSYSAIQPRTIVPEAEELIQNWKSTESFTLTAEGAGTSDGGMTSGLKVLELTTVVAAPYCGICLSQHGAESTRIASPDPKHDDLVEVIAATDVQRGKKNIIADLKTDAGQDQLRELVGEADVVVCNMRPEAAAKLNVDFAGIKAIKKNVVYCRISAYPNSERPGYDPLLQVATGVVDSYRSDSGSGLPNFLGLAGSVDYGGGATGFLASVLGLVGQARNGGQGAYNVTASLAQFAQFIQSNKIVTGDGLPELSESDIPLAQTRDENGWEYLPTAQTDGDSQEALPVPVVTLKSLKETAVSVTSEQVGKPCSVDLPADSVIRQEQHDGSTDHFPAPTHVRFERAANPLILPATVLPTPKKIGR